MRLRPLRVMLTTFVIMGVIIGSSMVGLMVVSPSMACTAPTSIPSPNTSSSVVAATVATELPDETVKYLDSRNVKELAEKNKERYLFAQEKTGLPWQVIATLHYREAGMNPGSSISNGAPLGSGVNVDGVNVVSDPNTDAENMAALFLRLAKGVYDIDVIGQLGNMSVEDWGKSFLAYNRGYLFERKGASYQISPYVMNGFDKDHMNMRWSYADTVSGFDGNKAGALAVLAYLGGVSLSEVCTGTGDGTVVAPTDGEGTLLVTSGFGIRTRTSGITRPHQGIDVVTGDAIHAIMGGTVKEAEYSSGYGWYVKIDHGNGAYSLYGHMVPGSLQVGEGQKVNPGDPLGTMGNSGDSEGVHLHLQVWENDTLINPFAFLMEHGIKLEWAEDAYPINTKPGPL